MTNAIIISICVLILIAYLFDVSTSKTKIPSVILLIILGFVLKYVAQLFSIAIPDLQFALPILGTVGLILIVLEGSLELEVTREKRPMIWKSVAISLMGMLLLSFVIAYAISYLTSVSIQTALASSIPLALISSAIAIPSVLNLAKHDREFIIYESSLSDIFGVLFFNFIVFNEVIDLVCVSNFVIQILLMLFVSVVITLLLMFLLGKIKHHIKFLPIIIMIILVYSVSKTFHLPALIFILLFGLVLVNVDNMKEIAWLEGLTTTNFKQELVKFKELSIEFAFLVRVLFFILFGFLLELQDLLNPRSLVWSLGIVGVIYTTRIFLLKLIRIPLFPALTIAPRGLITILLFLSIPTQLQSDLVNQSVILQVIVITAFVMMLGLLFHKKV